MLQQAPCVSLAFMPCQSHQYHIKPLLVEVTYSLLCHPWQCRQQLNIRLACSRKCPCCVGKALRIEVAHMPFCYPCQRLKQLRIRLARCRKRPYRVGEVLCFEVANTPLCRCPRQRCKQL